MKTGDLVRHKGSKKLYLVAGKYPDNWMNKLVKVYNSEQNVMRWFEREWLEVLNESR